MNILISENDVKNSNLLVDKFNVKNKISFLVNEKGQIIDFNNIFQPIFSISFVPGTVSENLPTIFKGLIHKIHVLCIEIRFFFK